MKRPQWWEWLILALVIGIIYAMLAPIFYAAKGKAPATSCLSNMKQQGTALMMYSQDYDENFPAQTDKWMDAIYPYLKSWKIFHCPSLKEREFGYAFNEKLAGKSAESLTNSATIEMSFESVDRWKNASGNREKFSVRHDGFGNIAFADGHGKALNRDSFKMLPAPSWQENETTGTKGVTKEPNL